MTELGKVTAVPTPALVEYRLVPIWSDGRLWADRTRHKGARLSDTLHWRRVRDVYVLCAFASGSALFDFHCRTPVYRLFGKKLKRRAACNQRAPLSLHTISDTPASRMKCDRPMSSKRRPIRTGATCLGAVARRRWIRSDRVAGLKIVAARAVCLFALQTPTK